MFIVILCGKRLAAFLYRTLRKILYTIENELSTVKKKQRLTIGKMLLDKVVKYGKITLFSR